MRNDNRNSPSVLKTLFVVLERNRHFSRSRLNTEHTFAYSSSSTTAVRNSSQRVFVFMQALLNIDNTTLAERDSCNYYSFRLETENNEYII